MFKYAKGVVGTSVKSIRRMADVLAVDLHAMNDKWGIDEMTVPRWQVIGGDVVVQFEYESARYDASLGDGVGLTTISHTEHGPSDDEIVRFFENMGMPGPKDDPVTVEAACTHTGCQIFRQQPFKFCYEHAIQHGLVQE